jgi:hypothetical protein
MVAKDMQCKDKFFVWSMIVAESFQSSNLEGYIILKDSKKLPLTFNKVSSLIKQCIIFTLFYSWSCCGVLISVPNLTWPSETNVNV